MRFWGCNQKLDLDSLDEEKGKPSLGHCWSLVSAWAEQRAIAEGKTSVCLRGFPAAWQSDGTECVNINPFFKI